MAGARKSISRVNMVRQTPGVSFGDVWYEPGGEFGPRIQAEYQMVIVHLGEAAVTFDQDRCTIPPGSVALMRPGRREYFRFSAHRRTHHTWCTVAPGAIPAALRRRLDRLPPVLSVSPPFDFLMKAAFGIRLWREPAGREMLLVLGLALLREYARLAAAGPGETGRESPWDRAREYLEEHCAGENVLREAARVAGVTPQHLIRLFRQKYRITPGRYLWRTRVERGAGLLAATGLTVGEIADRCGFRNPFHFSRLLREMQGVSPRQFRQRMAAARA
jgi:AraC-like DNA-binding protein